VVARVSDGVQYLGHATYQWYDLGWILREVLCQLVVVNNEVGNVNIAVVLLDKHVFPDLVSSMLVRFGVSDLGKILVPVDEDIVEGELHDKVNQGLLNAGRCRGILDAIASLAPEEADRVCRLSVRHDTFAMSRCR
jgi:hypothetical protein